MISIEEKLKNLGEKIRDIDKHKLPPSEKCLEIIAGMMDYREGSMEDKEKENFKNHLKSCLWCFNSYMNFTRTLVLAEAGKLESEPQWVKDKGDSIFKGITLFKRLRALEATVKGLLAIRLYKLVPGLQRGIDEEEIDEKREFMPEEKMKLSFTNQAKKASHLTVIHWNSEGKVSLVYPFKKEHRTLIKEDESIEVKGRATLPAGEAAFKAFFTEKQIINPEEIDYKDEKSVTGAIEKFLEEIEKMPEDKWSELIQEYIVVEG